MTIQTSRATPLAAAITAVAALAGLAEPACDDFYQFTFGGVIDVVDGVVPEPWATVHVGSEFEFSYIFDSEAEDQMGIPWIGWYDILYAELTIEGAVQATREGEIRIIDLTKDDYIVYFSDLPIGAGGGLHLSGWEVLDSDELPLDINLDDWDAALFEVGGGGFSIKATATSFTGHIVPVPGTLMILVIWGMKATRGRPGFVIRLQYRPGGGYGFSRRPTAM